MTTIAYDGKTLAADTRYSIKNSYYGFVHKILPITKGGALATAGTVGGGHLLKAALETNWDLLKSMTKKQLDLLDAIYIDGNGDPYCLDPDAYRFLPIDEKSYACGSGEKTAMAFLRAGFSAEDAIKATSKVDNNSNDLVDVYDIKRKAFRLVNFPR